MEFRTTQASTASPLVTTDHTGEYHVIDSEYHVDIAFLTDKNGAPKVPRRRL